MRKTSCASNDKAFEIPILFAFPKPKFSSVWMGEIPRLFRMDRFSSWDPLSMTWMGLEGDSVRIALIHFSIKASPLYVTTTKWVD